MCILAHFRVFRSARSSLHEDSFFAKTFGYYKERNDRPMFTEVIIDEHDRGVPYAEAGHGKETTWVGDVGFEDNATILDSGGHRQPSRANSDISFHSGRPVSARSDHSTVSDRSLTDEHASAKSGISRLSDRTSMRSDQSARSFTDDHQSRKSYGSFNDDHVSVKPSDSRVSLTHQSSDRDRVGMTPRHGFSYDTSITGCQTDGRLPEPIIVYTVCPPCQPETPICTGYASRGEVCSNPVPPAECSKCNNLVCSTCGQCLKDLIESNRRGIDFNIPDHVRSSAVCDGQSVGPEKSLDICLLAPSKCRSASSVTSCKSLRIRSGQPSKSISPSADSVERIRTESACSSRSQTRAGSVSNRSSLCRSSKTGLSSADHSNSMTSVRSRSGHQHRHSFDQHTTETEPDTEPLYSSKTEDHLPDVDSVPTQRILLMRPGSSVSPTMNLMLDRPCRNRQASSLLYNSSPDRNRFYPVCGRPIPDTRIRSLSWSYASNDYSRLLTPYQYHGSSSGCSSLRCLQEYPSLWSATADYRRGVQSSRSRPGYQTATCGKKKRMKKKRKRSRTRSASSSLRTNRNKNDKLRGRKRLRSSRSSAVSSVRARNKNQKPKRRRRSRSLSSRSSAPSGSSSNRNERSRSSAGSKVSARNRSKDSKSSLKSSSHSSITRKITPTPNLAIVSVTTHHSRTGSAVHRPAYSHQKTASTERNGTIMRTSPRSTSLNRDPTEARHGSRSHSKRSMNTSYKSKARSTSGSVTSAKSSRSRRSQPRGTSKSKKRKHGSNRSLNTNLKRTSSVNTSIHSSRPSSRSTSVATSSATNASRSRKMKHDHIPISGSPMTSTTREKRHSRKTQSSSRSLSSSKSRRS